MKNNRIRIILTALGSLMIALTAGTLLTGCGQDGAGGYSNSWLYPEDVSTVYVEMFDSTSFRRGYEFVLTDAVCKRVETDTPYKIVSDRNLADTVLSGVMSGVGQSVLTRERYTGRSLEREVYTRVRVSWKNLKTGELLINNEEVIGYAGYSNYVTPAESFEYAADLAVNRAAEKVVELMQSPW